MSSSSALTLIFLLAIVSPATVAGVRDDQVDQAVAQDVLISQGLSAFATSKSTRTNALPVGTQTVGYNKFVEGRTRPGRTAADSYGKAGRASNPGTDAVYRGNKCETTITCNGDDKVKIRASTEFCKVVISHNGEKKSCMPDREDACREYNKIVYEVKVANANDAGSMYGFAKGGLVEWKNKAGFVGEVMNFTFRPETLHDDIPLVMIDVKFPRLDDPHKTSKIREIAPWELTVVSDTKCFPAVRFAVQRHGMTAMKSDKCKCPEGLVVVPMSSASDELCKTPNVRTFAPDDLKDKRCQCGLPSP